MANILDSANITLMMANQAQKENHFWYNVGLKMSMLPYMLTHHRDHSEFVMSAERSPSALPRVEQDGRAAQVLHHHREYQHHQCQHHHQH